MKRVLRLCVCAAAALAAGCSSQWYAGYSHHDIVRTDVVIRTTPPGAVLVFDGKNLPEASPIRMPVEYNHTETLYERQSNYGTKMREDMGTVGSILTFPIWMIASIFHYKEDLRRHEYGGNVHTVTALAAGYDEMQETITLEGESEHPVTMKLVKSR